MFGRNFEWTHVVQRFLIRSDQDVVYHDGHILCPDLIPAEKVFKRLLGMDPGRRDRGRIHPSLVTTVCISTG